MLLVLAVIVIELNTVVSPMIMYSTLRKRLDLFLVILVIEAVVCIDRDYLLG